MVSEEGKTKMVTIRCSDGVEFVVDAAVCSLSQTISYIIEDCGHQETISVPLPHVDSLTFGKVLTYMTKHASKAPINENNLKAWDAEYMEIDRDTLYNLLLASNYMEIKDLVHLCAAKVADMIRGKQPEEIREIFNIKNDFTPEEEEEVRKEYAWALN
ncbi:hypothetical protein Cni_G07401 [Canna indica]|uniref:SKP1-like protein n=1 Tax=Canna indica TaxID=4628 RepID=A0AAQ3JYE9_9LILI|nr:hypothetical protein Cni_G07401 [Canna indica]